MSLSPDAIEAVGIFENSVLIDIGVRRWRSLQQRRLRGHRDGRALRLDGQADFQVHGHRAPDCQIAMVMLEAGEHRLRGGRRSEGYW